MSSPSIRVVQDRLVNADGTGAAGTLQVSWTPGVSPDGFPIAGGRLVVRLNNGGFNISLTPGSYQVKYILAHGQQRSETWNVPNAPGPFRIADVKQ